MADVPDGVVTVMSTVPVGSAGEVTVIDVLELTVNAVVETFPNQTAVAPEKFVPVRLTDVPPAVVPDVGLTAVTAGAGAVTFVYVNWSADRVEEVPEGVVTVTWTVPAACAGEYTLIDVSEFTTKFTAARF